MRPTATMASVASALRRWLDGLAGLQDPSTGLWWSWRGPGARAYRYEEATAWVILLAAELRAAGLDGLDGLDTTQIEAGCGALDAAIASRGGIGRAGRVYAFDTAVALAALTAWGGLDRAIACLHATLDEMRAARCAVTAGHAAGGETAETRWSEAWGAHMLWACRALTADDQRVVPDLIDALLPLQRADGAFAVHRASTAAYAHATAYAAEGLIDCGRADGVAAAKRAIAALVAGLGATDTVVAWLPDIEAPPRADNQAPRPAAAIGPARVPHDSADRRLDATAQLARLLYLADGQDRALADRLINGLIARTATDGLIPWRDGSADRNSWTTVFAARAALAALTAKH